MQIIKTESSPVIGLEIHVELATKSKMFCACPADHFARIPNTQTCPVCLGLPGALPVPNKKAIDWTVKIGSALNCTINQHSKFDRKHYFYPDLPKGYQISQYDQPFCVKGELMTDEGKVRINRVHLEEDTGKLIHKNINGKNVTLIDFNRSGVPLVEIVTEPDIHSASQAQQFAKKLKQILRYLEVSDCDMEKGSMRLEANISWGMNLGYKVEVKNLNSFRFVKKAIDYEVRRQKKLLDKNQYPKQETRGWDETKNITIIQRIKETAADYRYFPEPDIPPIFLGHALIEKMKKELPELPDAKQKRWSKQYSIKDQYLEILSSNKQTAKYFDDSLKLISKSTIQPNEVADYIVNKKINIRKTNPQDLLNKLKKKSIKITDDKILTTWINQVIKDSSPAVTDYMSGKNKAIGVLVGRVMKLSKGMADARKVTKIIEKKLKNK